MPWACHAGIATDPLTGRPGPTDPTASAAGQLGPGVAPASSTPAATSAAAPAAATPVPAWLQQAVEAQLTGRLVAAARGAGADSVQRLTVHLHPADLGAIQVIATMDDGTVSLQLLAGNAATRDALRASLGVLRSDLAGAGLDGTRLDVSDQPPSQQGAGQHQSGAMSDGSAGSFTGSTRSTADGHQPGRRSVDAVPATAARVAAVRPAPPGVAQGVDLRL